MKKYIFNNSFWEKETYLKDNDFVIIGAGFTGKYIAMGLALKYPKASICIIDRGPFSTGASTRNAGFATFGNVSEIVDDLSIMEYDDVLNLIKDRYDGLNWILSNFNPKSFDYTQSGGFELFENIKSKENAFENLGRVNQIMETATGISNVFKENILPDNRFKFEKSTLFNQYEGMLHPGKLNQLIDKRLVKLNVKFLYGLEIESIENQNINTIQGISLKAKQIFIATNAFTPNLIELDKNEIIPARGQIFVTNKLKKPIPPGIYHCDDGYIYFRSLGNRLLIGGGRNKFLKIEENNQIKINETVIDYLNEFIRSRVLTNDSYEIEYKWSGIMAMGKGKYPFIQKIPKSNHIVCARMGGIGVALSPIAAQKAINMYEGA